MSDYTRGDDPVYNGFREGWKCPRDAKEEDIELNEIVEGIDLDRLREMCDAERDGRCVVLKVAVGDRVHDTLSGCDFTVKKIDLYTDMVVYRCGNVGTEDYIAFHEFEFGERFTRPEAEAALKGASND